jgi:hypothetical protein
VLRIQQSDLESLFFSAADDALPRGKAVNPEDADQQALEVMRAAGIAPETCSEVLVAVKQSAKAGDTETVLDILNQLAYDTDVDLEELRQVFAEISAATRTATSASPSASRDPAPKEARPAQAALAEFDRGRAAGRDLNELFGTLERELDIDRDEAGAVALDGAVTRFPGVVGAMIEEFLWDVERQHGKAAAQSYEQLRLLSEYAANVEDFEELGEREMLDFSARWLLDEGEVAPAKARAVLGALEPFCRWCEEQHSHALWKAFGSALEELKESVPRLIELRATRARDEHLSSGAFRVCEVAETGLLLESLALGADDAKRVHIEITPQQAKHVRADDLVRLTAAEPLRIGACYPAPVASFLRSHA